MSAVQEPWHVLAPTGGDARWTHLAEMVASGDLLLNGSQTPGLRQLTPREPLDFSIDDFSKHTAIYATEDPTWAIAYAVRSAACRQFLNACFYPLDSSGRRQPRRILLSYAKNDDAALAPLSPGVVYALPREQFRRMPPHADPILGPILECQWASTEPAPVVAEVPVTPRNLPLSPHFHDFDTVASREQARREGSPYERPGTCVAGIATI